MEDGARFMEPLRSVFAGRRVACFGGVVQAHAQRVASLAALGAERPLVVGAMGTGPPPDADLEVVEVHGAEVMDDFRTWERFAADPPPAVVEALDRYRPDLVMTLGVDAMRVVAGRRVYGGRPASWLALEDKVVVDAFLDRAGVDRAPSTVVP